MSTEPAGVTVVVPTRDRAELLATTLATVLDQRPQPYVVVIDDGRDDGTEALARELGAEYVPADPRGPRGASAARNAGLERVRTELVAFVDSDDLLLPGALAALERALAQAPGAPFACGRGLAARPTAAGWRSEGLIAPLPGELAAPRGSLYVRNWVPSSGALVRTAAARAVGGYDASLAFSEDHDFWLRLAGLGDPVHVPRVVSIYRRHASNRHGSVRARRDEDAIGALATGDPALAALAPERAGTRLAEAALEAARTRDADAARGVAVDMWLRRPQRGRALSAAVRHARRRRAAARAGALVLREDRALATWLDARR